MRSTEGIIIFFTIIVTPSFGAKKIDIKLFNEASEHLVRVKDGLKVDSKGLYGKDETSTTLYIESAEKHNKSILGSYPKIRLRGGSNAELLVCFNKRGSIILRKGRRIKNRRKCTFQEIPNEGFVMYRSMYNHNWFLGFNEEGEILSAPYNNLCHNKSDFFKFVKKILKAGNVPEDITKYLCLRRWATIPAVPKHFLHPLY